MVKTKLEVVLHLLKCILLNLNPAATWCKPSFIFKNIWSTLNAFYWSSFHASTQKENKQVLMYNWNLKLKSPVVANLRWKSFSELSFHYSYNNIIKTTYILKFWEIIVKYNSKNFVGTSLFIDLWKEVIKN